MRNKKRCPNCKSKLLRIFPNCLYLREVERISYLEPILNKNFFYGCINCSYAKNGGKWKGK